MLYVPFAIFLLNSAFVHAQVYDKLYTDKAECQADLQKAITQALEHTPEGGSISGGCIGLPESVKKPETPIKPTPNQKETKDNEI